MAASVTFTFGAYFHDADDLADFVTAARRSPATSRAPQGSLVITAAGTRRWTQSPGVNESFQVQTRTRDKTVHDWLNQRDGELVLYRDQRGRKEYGVITNVSVSDLHSGLYDISVDFLPVEHTPTPIDAGVSA